MGTRSRSGTLLDIEYIKNNKITLLLLYCGTNIDLPTSKLHCIHMMSSTVYWLFVVTVAVLFLLPQIDAVTCSSDEIKVQKKGVNIESNGCSKPAFIEVPG